MDWGTKRKFIILTVFFGIIFIILAIFVYFKFLNKVPTCFDGIRNQDEQGVDCGGVCALICPEESRPINIVYSRLFNIGYGVYSAVAIVENLNQNVFAKDVSYTFKVYDDQNILLKEVFGTTFVPPGRTFPIFEHSITTGNREATKITFEIAGDVIWEKGVFKEPIIKVSNIASQNIDTRSRITADIQNYEVYALRNLPVIAVVYDALGNAREASGTRIEYLSPNDKTSVTFTWNHKFDFEVSKIDIVPRAMPREWNVR